MPKITFDLAPIDSREIVRRIQKIEAAKQEVRPLAGNVGMAADSADAVYLEAMEALGRDCTDIADYAGAATAIWPTFKRSHQGAPARPRMATDTKTIKSRQEMFGDNANRLRNGF